MENFTFAVGIAGLASFARPSRRMRRRLRPSFWLCAEPLAGFEIIHIAVSYGLPPLRSMKIIGPQPSPPWGRETGRSIEGRQGAGSLRLLPTSRFEHNAVMVADMRQERNSLIEETVGLNLVTSILSDVTMVTPKSCARATNSQSYAEQPEVAASRSTRAETISNS